MSKGRVVAVRLRILLFVLACGQSVAAHDDDFDARVRNYILNNPEVILEALEHLSQEQAQAALVEKISAHPKLFDSPSVLGVGAPGAPLRVVEFFDYKCAPCKAIHPDLVALTAANPDLRIEMMHLPILSPGSERAARFALATQAVFGDDAYGAVHSALWEMRGHLNTSGFERIANDLGLEFAPIEAKMDDDVISAIIGDNRNLAIDLGIFGTPAFVSRVSLSIGSTDVDALAKTWLSDPNVSSLP